jgi:chromosome segregation ATPase
MSGGLTFAMIMDIAVLGLLATTVFLGFRLTTALRNFRESRQDMEGLLNRLVAQISKAEDAISGLQNTTRTSGVQLQEVINESKFLADELRFMNEAGNNLADRLEKLAEKNSALVTEMDNRGTSSSIAREYRELEMTLNDEQDSGFVLEDRFYDEDYPEDHFAAEADSSGLQSQAERELFEALTRRMKQKARA